MKRLRYVVVDGMFHGTGLRDDGEGGYLDLEEFGMSPELQADFEAWLQRYEGVHLDRYQDQDEIATLDKIGIDLCRRLEQEAPETRTRYFSNGLMERIPFKSDRVSGTEA